MATVKNNFIDYNLSNIIDNYLNNKIEESDLYNELDSLLFVNEGIIDNIKDFIDKSIATTEDAIITLCVKVYLKLLPLLEYGKKFLGKILNILIWMIKKLQNFAKKHPVLMKVIVISAIIIFILIASTQSATAGEKSSIEVDKNHIDVLLGMLKKYGNDINNHMKIEAMLIDAKDGFIDGPWTKKEVTDTIHQQNTLLHNVLKSMQEQGYSSTSLGQLLDDMQKTGDKLISFSVEIIKGINFNSENIKIFTK